MKVEEFDYTESLAKIDKWEQDLTQTKQELIEAFGPQIILAAEALKNIDNIMNTIKNLRGQIMEFIV